MDGQTTLLILFSLATVAFFVFLWFSAKTWTIPHLVATIFVYFAIVFFAVMAAATLRTHQAWRETAMALEKKLAQTQFESELLEKGAARDPDGELRELEQLAEELQVSTLSLARLDSLIEQEIADRGRVWRHLVPQSAGAGGYTLSTAPPDLPEGETPPPNRMQPRMVVYAFREGEVPQEDAEPLLLPVAYIGEFAVAAATDTTVTLTPTVDSPALQAQARQPGTWTLHETMPGDRHTAFEYAIRGATTVDEAKQALGRILPKGQGVTDASYDAMLTEYAKHLLGVKPDDSDPPENVWTKVRFKRPHRLRVDEEQPAAGVEAYFQDGLTLPMILRRGGEAEVGPGDVAVLETTKARELIAQDIVEEIDQVYVRQLRDYAYLFRQIEHERRRNAESLATVNRDIAAISRSVEKIVIELTYRQEEIDRLKGDRTNFQREVDVLNKYFAELTEMRQALYAERATLMQRIVYAAEQLEKLQREAAARIEEQTRQASAATPSAVPATP